MRTIRRIIIHCSATKENVAYSINQLLSDHMRQGFKGIGYHYFISRGGCTYACRSLESIGAHTKNCNLDSIGICYEGGLDSKGNPSDTRNVLQKKELESLLRSLLQRFPTITEILGHRDCSTDLDGNGKITPNEWVKLCPCFDAQKEYSHLLKK